MTCIRPTAPFGDGALGLPSLSTRMTARIHDAGTEKRLAASSMKDCHGTAVPAAPVAAGPACARTDAEVATAAAAIMPTRRDSRAIGLFTPVAATDESSSDGICRCRARDGTNWRG